MSSTGLDKCLNLVADRHRRRLIHQLRHGGNGERTIETLVDQLNGSEQAAAENRPSDRSELAIQVYHNHLPKLAELGVVEYDRERGTVQYRPNERVETVLDSLPEEFATANP